MEIKHEGPFGVRVIGFTLRRATKKADLFGCATKRPADEAT